MDKQRIRIGESKAIKRIYFYVGIFCKRSRVEKGENTEIKRFKFLYEFFVREIGSKRGKIQFAIKIFYKFF